MSCGDNPALSYLLSSYAVPKACEVPLVQGEIDGLTSEIPQLRAKLKKYEQNLRLYRAAMSPIRRVPAEIWGEIFAFALPKKFFQEDDRWDLVVLQLVCKAWRDAAWSKHQLWSGVHVDMKDFEEFPREKIEEWLNRSGSVPRFLKVSLPNHQDCEKQDSPCRVHNPALASLLAKGQPLWELSLVYRDARCFQILLDSLKAVEAPSTNRPWDSLSSLTCIFLDRWTALPDPSKSTFMSLPPNVTSFELRLPGTCSVFPNDPAPNQLNIPPWFLEQLTSFSLSGSPEGLGWLECTLPYCTKVEELSLHCSDYWTYDRNDNAVQQRQRSGFLLPKVRSFKLSQTFALGILDLFVTPQLLKLDISGPRSIRNTNCEPVLGFIERSKCIASLQCLRLRNLQLDALQFATTLRGFPSLTHLTLDGIVTTARADHPFLAPARIGLLDLLRCHDPPSLPQLQVLELLSLNSTEDEESLLEFLWSRPPSSQGPPDTLKELTVTFERTVNPNRSRPFIEKLKKCDVSVRVAFKVNRNY